MLRAVVGCAVALCLSSTAFADEASARKKYDAGERAYNLGEFDKAVALFKEAYADWAEPAFLFNIAQTYRQMGDCKQALFFYKRFLALKQNDTKKPIRPGLQTEVEKRIVELEECIRRELASKPPDALDSGTAGSSQTGQTGQTGGTGATGTPTPTNASTTTAQAPEQPDQGEPDEGEEEPTEAPTGLQPKVVSVRLDGGAALLTAGDLETPALFAGALIAGYPLAINPKLSLELGAAFSFAPVPFTTTMDVEGSGMLIGALANVAPSLTLIPKLAARLDVGAGVLVFTGLDLEGNPFTMNGTAATGALSTFHARVAASLDYAVTPNLVVTATPIAFAYSPAPTGFDSTISSLTTLSFLVGVGYRQ